MWYALMTYANGNRRFFDQDPLTREEFATKEQCENAISEWRRMVTPRMAEETQFEIMHG